jgi:uncharacterized protein (TIGR02246 family)
MSDTTDLVDRQIAAYQERDLDAFLTFYAKDVRIRQFDGSVVADGTDGLRSFYEPLFRDSPQLKARILHRIAAGDYVIDEEETTGVNVPGYPATMHAVVIYQVKDGLIHDVIFLM